MTYTFAQRTAGLRSSAIRDLLKLTEMSHMLSLAGGLPTPDSFPLPDLRREADRLLGEYGPRVVQYSATDGVVELRQWIADEYTDVLGRPVAVEGEIVVTHGSQQALDLLAKVLVDPGDIVVSESPAYLGAVQAIELFQPRFEVIPGDEHGMQVELLAERLEAGLRPKFVYVVPNFHNPSGATMSLERRQLLAALADRYELLIIEDDPYGAIRFHGDPLPPVASFTNRVVYLSTFSKIVAPGFRVGWMIGPPEVIGLGGSCQTGRRPAHVELRPAAAGQRGRPGGMARRPEGADRADVPRSLHRTVGRARRRHSATRSAFHRPDGGMFLWSTFPGIADTTELLRRAVDEGVAFVPGNAFTIDQVPDSKARFSYSTLSPAQLGEAADRLARAVARS